MSTLIEKISKGVTTRLARNTLFWIIVIIFVYDINSATYVYDKSIYLRYKLLCTAMLFIMTYINNLLLVPELLAKKKRILYIISAATLLFITSAVYILTLKKIQASYPEIHVYDVSILTSPISADMSLAGILEDIPTFAFGLGLWLLIFIMAWYMQDYAKQEKIAQEAAHKQTQAELNMLRNQVNPHFLFNTLNNIYGLSLQKSDNAPESLLKLSSIMRYMLYDADTPLMPFEKEKEIMQAYIDMELLRLQQSEKFNFTITADRNYSIPPLLWLPILENIFKHGTRVISDDYFIDYQFSITDNTIQISATNNCKGTNNQPGGIGLDNLRKRLDILYPGMYQLVIQRNKTQYHTELTVTLS